MKKIRHVKEQGMKSVKKSSQTIVALNQGLRALAYIKFDRSYNPMRTLFNIQRSNLALQFFVTEIGFLELPFYFFRADVR